MTGFVEIPTLEQYCSYCGQRCLHPDIGIITSGGLPDGQAFKGNFYAICFGGHGAGINVTDADVMISRLLP